MMNKRILVIRGSARNQGYTNRLCDAVKDILPHCTVEYFDTYKDDFEPCNGCNFCEKNGRCVYRDLDGFFDSFKKADLVIFASPVYNGSFSAPMKSLIDRFQVFYTNFYSKGKVQQIEKFREAVLITASGRDGEKAVEYMRSQLDCAFTILNMKMKSVVHCANTDTEPDYEGALRKLKRSLSDE